MEENGTRNFVFAPLSSGVMRAEHGEPLSKLFHLDFYDAVTRALNDSSWCSSTNNQVFKANHIPLQTRRNATDILVLARISLLNSPNGFC